MFGGDVGAVMLRSVTRYVVQLVVAKRVCFRGLGGRCYSRGGELTDRQRRTARRVHGKLVAAVDDCGELIWALGSCGAVATLHLSFNLPPSR
jgi:hypothetical protein